MRRSSVLLACGVAFTGATGSATGQALAGHIAGVVYDSVAGVPLAGANVQLLALDAPLQPVTRRTVDTDTAGRFVVDGLPAGRYLVGFFHPKLDSLGVEAPVRRMAFRAGRDYAIDLAIPSAATVIASWCGGAAARDSSGVVLGVVRDVRTAAALGGTRITAQWSAITIGVRGARAEVEQTSTLTDAHGWFGLCGVPRGGVVVLRAATPNDSSPPLELDVPDDGVLMRDLALQRGDDVPAVPGPGVHGTIRDPFGEALAGVRVRLWGTTTEVRTDAGGEFRLSTSVAGTQLLDARIIGFVPLRRVVDVLPERGARIDLVMTDFPTEIDTVRVLATRRSPHDALAGFERRRRLGHGQFLDPDDVELRRPLVFTDLMRGLAGVHIRSVDLMTRTVQMRATSGLTCTPVVVVDGVRFPVDEVNVDDVIPADVVRAVEVYPRRMQAPAEYQATDCGSIVVWTGLRGWLAKRPPHRR